MNLIQKYVNKDLPRRIKERVLPNLKYMTKTRARSCRACRRKSIFIQLAEHEEFRVCFRCGANLRYEMLAEYLHEIGGVPGKVVLELDTKTPVSPILADADRYIYTYYRPAHAPGQKRADGAQMEDITNLTFENESFDLILSSDVLEHVPDALKAFQETHRTLKPGGAHLFTVPNEAKTIKRAEIRNGSVIHLVDTPEYHSDPLDPKGILAFWHYGKDLQEQFGESGLNFSIVKGPEGVRDRIVWEARKPVPA